MQFIDLATQQKRILETLKQNIQKVLDHGQYIMGPEVMDLENQLASFVGAKYGVSCASGTDALLLALMSYNIGPGDAVLTTPFTFISTAEVIAILGATPIFVDIDRKTFNISPDRLESAIGVLETQDLKMSPFLRNNRKDFPIPKGIIAVDLFGLTADYDQINAIAKRHGIFVIQDAAQSFGAEYKDRKACSLAEVGCTSFFPAKPLGCYGDGGMCFTDLPEIAEVMSSLRIHGKGGNKYDSVRIGLNGRLDTLQAAILLAKFEIFREEIKLRQQVAGRYADLLRDVPQIQLPAVPEGYKSVWAQYSVLAESEQQRDLLQANLKERGIPTAIYYPKPLHLQTAFSFLGYREGDFPVSEDWSRRIFSLPMHPYLTEADQEEIATAMRSL
jgi:dTDP-4-amino-4,6-dideoxygalactose transaminase